VAAAPLYLKGHSYGEFVFDQSFAQLAGQLGLRYYPKLVGMSPLSPVEGYRFLIAAGEDEAAITAVMLELIDAFCRQNGLLSCNFLYVDCRWRPLAEAAGCSAWINQQGCWTNPGFGDFEAYLAGFNANQRRNVRRERAAVAAANRDWFALDSTLQTLQLLRDLCFRPDETAAAIQVVQGEITRARGPSSPRQVLLFSGHMMDAPDRPQPRFPPAKEAAAAQRIAAARKDGAIGK